MPGALKWMSPVSSIGQPNATSHTEQHNAVIVGSCLFWRRFSVLLCTFTLKPYLVCGHEGLVLCVHSPFWHQVTADCGCDPVLLETPAGAPTGWLPWRCCCGDWWRWRRWPHRGLGCNALREKEGERERPTQRLVRLSAPVCYSCHRYAEKKHSSAGSTTRTPNQPHSPALWLRQGRTRANKHTLTRPLLLSA